jgi:hypothetical protein
MRIQQLKTLLRHLWNIGTQADRPVYIPTLIWGEAGVGKSEAVKQTVREIFEIDEKDDERLRYHFIDLRIGNMEPSDLIGIPTDQMVYPCPECCAKRASSSSQSSSMQGTGRKYELADLVWHLHHRHGEVVEGMNGQQILNFIMREIHQKWEDEISTRTVFSTPDWFPSEGLAPDQREGGFLFLDEINRGSSDTFQAIFQILLDRRLHLHNLPKKWVILAASNPAESKGGNSYVINEDFTQDHALMTRFLHISLEPDNRGWLTYAAKKNLYEPIRLLVGMDPSYLGPITAVLPEQIWPVPRTWSFLNDIFRDLPPSTDDSLKEDIATGLIGVIHGNEWIMLKKRSETPLTPTEILDRYQEEAIRDKFRSQIAEKKMGLIGTAIEHLSDYLIQLYKKSTLSKDQEDNLISAILDLDIAHSYQFITTRLRDSSLGKLRVRVYDNEAVKQRIRRAIIDISSTTEEIKTLNTIPKKFEQYTPKKPEGS